ncbi:MAG: hypothetical protein KJ721_00350, partial [Nanoarchaeota archaeon]|nr:hypothetical protein [Nanoarchaeota archaeon]
MKIRKIRKSDFKEYVKLRENEAKNYSKVIGKKIEWPPKNIIRKEMKKAIQDRKNYILVMIDKDSLIAYLHGVIEGYS